MIRAIEADLDWEPAAAALAVNDPIAAPEAFFRKLLRVTAAISLCAQGNASLDRLRRGRALKFMLLAQIAGRCFRGAACEAIPGAQARPSTAGVVIEADLGPDFGVENHNRILPNRSF
jgi:hypothetical protein